mmetsp:Transcript_47717/g.137424  ORF Transcript_47717/g.137424 Transcript_47717/m.137424 type:complete len:118 (+) Transcript_47717:676-1029(+)
MAVNPATGARLGPRGTQEELEYGMLRQLGAVDDATLIVAPVREFQLADHIPSDPALCDDVPVDVVCTPLRVLRIEARLPKPLGIRRDPLSSQAERHKLTRKLNGKLQQPQSRSGDYF